MLKRKKYIILIIVIIIYYGFLSLFKVVIAENISLAPSNYTLSQNCLVVKGQAVTGPGIRIVEGSEFLTEAIALPLPDDLNIDEIEMTGKSIYDSFLKYPDYYACDWLIYGQVTGTTERYEETGAGTIPVFDCEKMYPLMTLSTYLSTDTFVFYGFPLRFLIYLWPQVLLLVIYKKHKNLNRRPG